MKNYKQKQYDSLTKEYSDPLDKRIIRKYSIIPSFLKILGKLKGKTVLDVACGSGTSTKPIKKAGAKEVVGIDISKEMVNIAIKEEKENKLGIQYFVRDLRTLEKIKEFDFVTGIYILHYAKSKEDLLKMIKSVFINLKKGGKFLTILPNPKNPTQKDPRYEYVNEYIEKKEDGSKMSGIFVFNKKILGKIVWFSWKEETYVSLLKKVGFRRVKWIKPKITKDGIKKYGKDFWKPFQKNPSLMFLEVKK